MIAANNHYAGFGPGTLNIFRNMVGLSELSWEDQPQIQEQLRQQKEQEKINRSITQTSHLVRKPKLEIRCIIIGNIVGACMIGVGREWRSYDSGSPVAKTYSLYDLFI